jgi:hypothetical protein
MRLYHLALFAAVLPVSVPAAGGTLHPIDPSGTPVEICEALASDMPIEAKFSSSTAHANAVFARPLGRSNPGNHRATRGKHQPR